MRWPGTRQREGRPMRPSKTRSRHHTRPIKVQSAALIAQQAWAARDRERRRLHPRRELALDLIVGITMTGLFVALCLAYLNVIRWP